MGGTPWSHDAEGGEIELEDVTQNSMIVHSVRFDPDTVERLRHVADRWGMTPSQLIRQWVAERLTEEESPRSDPVETALADAVRKVLQHFELYGPLADVVERRAAGTGK